MGRRDVAGCHLIHWNFYGMCCMTDPVDSAVQGKRQLLREQDISAALKGKRAEVSHHIQHTCS